LAAVVDACLPVALITADPRQAIVAAKFRAWSSAGEDLHAPGILPYEIANVLSRLVWEGTFDPADVPHAWANIQAVGISLHSFDFLADGLQIASIARALRRKHASDCAYVTLALRLSCDVWTIDGQLARSAQAQGFPVQLLA